MSVIVTVMMFNFRLSRDNKESNNFLLHSFETEHLCSAERFVKKMLRHNDFNVKDNTFEQFFLNCHFNVLQTLKKILTSDRTFRHRFIA
jgi:hypothetical protein